MNSKPLILVCDDDEHFLNALYLSLKDQYEVHRATSVSQAKIQSQKFEYKAAIIDLNYEGQEYDGVYLLDRLSKCTPGTFLIVLSGDTSVKRVVEATRRKLFEFIHKGENAVEHLQTVLKRVVQIQAAQEKSTAARYLTESPVVKALLITAERIVRSHTNASILITGETGAGKEVLSRHIAHKTGKNAVTSNMAGIPRETAESVLFGHEKGAFTGATHNKIGLIESANGGIFFLDEIAEASLDVQAKLLRVLQEKEVLPLGANRPRKVDVRFIAATHGNLEALAATGHFRFDLLQRLNTFVLRLPPLRERPEDILLYTNLFLEEHLDNHSRYSLSDAAINVLMSYRWPGNIRQLKSVIQRIVVLSNKTRIDAEDVESAIQMGSEVTPQSSRVQGIEEDARRRRERVIQALRDSFGSKRSAAKLLKISEATLYRWIQELGISKLSSKGSNLLEKIEKAFL